MAACSSLNGSNLVDIKGVINCIICKGTPPPKLLQLDCFHSCHQKCVRDFIGNATPGSFIPCNECKAPCLVPIDDSKGFPEELLQFKVEGIAGTSPPCNICKIVVCKEIPSTHFCTTCKYYLCPDDLINHGKNKSDHKVFKNSQTLCAKHLISFEYFCLKCQVPLCQRCVQEDHDKAHTTINIERASQKCKEELRNKVMEIPNRRDQCESVINKLKNLLNDIEDNSKQQVGKCKKWGEDIKQAVDKIVNTQVQSIETTTQSQKNEINKITEIKSNLKTQFQIAEDYMDVFLKFGSDTDILKKCKIFLDRLKVILDKKVKIETNIIGTKFDVHCKYSTEIAKYLEEMLKVTKYCPTRPPPPSSFDLLFKWETGEGISGVAVSGEDIITVEGTNIEVHGMSGQKKGQIKCQGLGHAEDIEVINQQLYVIDSDPNKREILVLDREGKIERKISLPAQEHRLDYELCLAVDHNKEDIYIASAGTNTVHKCSKGQTMAHPFIRTRMGLDIPLYLCITPHHEVIVSNERSHSVSKYNSEGTLMWTYEGTGKGQLNRPAGVCVDPQGYIFVCDWCNNRIHHLSPEGNFLSYVNIGEQVLIQRPLAITFKNEKIIIAGKGHMYVVKCQYK